MAVNQPDDIQPFTEGERLMAEKMERLRRAVLAQADQAGNTYRTGSVYDLSDANFNVSARAQFMARTKGVGCPPPSGPTPSDYTDCRYWMEAIIPADGLSATDIVTWQAQNIPNLQRCLTATNLAELNVTTGSGTHLLPIGTPAMVWIYPSATVPGVFYYFFEVCPITVQVTLARDNDVRTNGVYASSTFTTTVATAATTGGVTNTTGAACIAINEPEFEIVTPANSIQIANTSGVYEGVIIGTDADSGKPIVRVCAPLMLDVTVSPDSGTNATFGPFYPPTYLYGVYDFTGRKIMSSQDTVWARPQALLTGYATKGRVGLKDTATLALMQVDEQPQFYVCST